MILFDCGAMATIETVSPEGTFCDTVQVPSSASDMELYSETTWAVGIALLTHRGPSGELMAQYRPPMSFCFYPTLYLGNHLYLLKPDSS